MTPTPQEQAKLTDASSNSGSDVDTSNHRDEKNAAGHVSATTPKTSHDFFRTFRFSRLVDPAEPWVLVENGSFLGYFDWLPEKYRVGPWSIAAICYLTVRE